MFIHWIPSLAQDQSFWHSGEVRTRRQQSCHSLNFYYQTSPLNHDSTAAMRRFCSAGHLIWNDSCQRTRVGPDFRQQVGEELPCSWFASSFFSDFNLKVQILNYISWFREDRNRAQLFCVYLPFVPIGKLSYSTLLKLKAEILVYLVMFSSLHKSQLTSSQRNVLLCW